MSDEEDQRMFENEAEDAGGHGEEAEPDDPMDDESPPKKSKTKGRDAVDEEEDEEEEDEEEEDDEDEEEEEEVPGRKSKKRPKLRHKNRLGASRFIDLEAEVSDDEEEEEEEEEYGAGTFIADADDVDDDLTRRNHALLDTSRHFDESENQSPEEIAKAVAQRHRESRAAPYTGDMNEIPQRLLMPSVHDASLWQIRVKPGRERDIVFSLIRKSIDVEYTARPLSILSAFQRDSLPGMIYVEARSAKQVQEACNGLVGVYPSRGIQLVPIEEMASLLQIKKQEMTLTPGTWVRIRRGKYAGDLAQVMDLTENGEDVGLRLIPRVDMAPRDDASLDPMSKKRKKVAIGTGTTRPPQRLFNYEEILKVYGRKNITKRNQAYVFQNETYQDGFLEKDFKFNALVVDDVNPTLDEITQFTRRQDGGDDQMVNLSVIAEASRKAAIAVLQPGDHIEVFEGEQAGLHGVVDEIAGDIVTITAQGLDLDGQKMEMPARSVRKRFKPGDHVKVMAGQNADETGLVVSVSDNVVTFVSDMSMQEISVFSKDLREAAEVGTGSNIVGNYELHDLVQLDAQTVGIIFKTERDSFRVLDQSGQVRLVQPHQISMRRDSSRAIATDSQGHELRVNDNMKEIDGEGRKGRVLHTHQSFFAFLHNRDITENGGVFVTRTRSLASLAPKSNAHSKSPADLSKMNPDLAAPSGGMVGSGAMGRGPRDRDIGATVTVVKGAHKGYVGTIKDTNGQIARVELRTGNKIISIEKDKLYRRLPEGRLEPMVGRGAGGRGFPGSMPPPRGGGGMSSSGWDNNSGPSFNSPNNNNNSASAWSGGRTQNPYIDNGGKTPAWNASSRTPNPYESSSGKTPAWNVSSRTPNPYASGRTPAWDGGSRTPSANTNANANPYATGANAGAGTGTGWGGATPGRNLNINAAGSSWGGATPGRNLSSSSSPAAAAAAGNDSGSGSGWGGAQAAGWGSPARSTAGGWDAGSSWSAPTPAAASTPGFGMGQTPAYSGAPTPGAFSSETPAGVWAAPTNAPTPGGGMSSYADPSVDNRNTVVDDNWLFDPLLSGYLTRLLIVINGTKETQYLSGDYEHRNGCILAAQQNPGEYEQTARVRLFASASAGKEEEEERSFVAKYIKPAEPKVGKEVLVLAGKQRGRVLVVRENDDDYDVVVSSKEDLNIIKISKTAVVPLVEPE